MARRLVERVIIAGFDIDVGTTVQAAFPPGEHAADGAQQTAAASQRLSLQVVELKQLIGAFRV